MSVPTILRPRSKTVSKSRQRNVKVRLYHHLLHLEIVLDVLNREVLVRSLHFHNTISVKMSEICLHWNANNVLTLVGNLIREANAAILRYILG